MCLLFFVVAFTTLILSALSAAPINPVDCTLTVNDKTYIRGVCEFEAQPDHSGSFSIYGNRNEYWATVIVENGKGTAYWNEVPNATRAQSPLGEVRMKGGCWENAKVRICALTLSPTTRAMIMGPGPNGLRLSPLNADRLCVSAPANQFVPGTGLVLVRCDSQFGARQRVFSLSDNKVSFKGRPNLCINVDGAPGALYLRLDDCTRVSMKWIYSKDEHVIRSDNGDLCWDYSDEMIARPCKQAADKHRQFYFKND